MRNACGNWKSLVTTAVLIGLMSVSSLSAAEKPWEEDTVLISPQGDQTVVQAFKGKKILFKNADPQLAIEWGLANARTTVVLAGKYVASDRIDIPRDGVTLIIDEDADLLLKGAATPITPRFRGRDGTRHPSTAVIYVRGRNHVRVMCFGNPPIDPPQSPQRTSPVRRYCRTVRFAVLFFRLASLTCTASKVL